MKFGAVKKLALLLAVLFLAAGAGACKPDRSGSTIRYDITGPVQNLDPQFSTDANARMIIANIFEGLIVEEPDGSFSPGVAQSWEISPDGTRYTFVLRPDACWADKEQSPVTAQDFVFAFERLFAPGVPSPFAGDFLHIRNASGVRSGVADVSRLGVEAPDAGTLVITLEQEDPFFLGALASTAAMPCNRAAFEAARGRYGLELKLVCSNGPFTLSRWSDKQINLTKSDSYRSDTPAQPGLVALYIGREDAMERFLDGGTDFALIPSGQAENVGQAGMPVQSFDKTTWCIVFNQNDPVWGNPLIRQGFSGAVDYGLLAEHLPEHFTPTTLFVSPAMRVGGESYRSLSEARAPYAGNAAEAARLFAMGLDALGLDALPDVTFYVPETDNHPLYMGLVQQCWQKTLDTYVTIERVSAGDLESRLRSGDFGVLLMPFSPASPRLESLFSAFASGSANNRFGYRSAVYDQLFAQARDQEDAGAAIRQYSLAEMTLLSDAVVIPAYFESVYYATGNGVRGINIHPFGNLVYFKHAQKD